MPCRLHAMATGISGLIQALVSILTVLSLLTSYNAGSNGILQHSLSSGVGVEESTTNLKTETSTANYTIGKWIPSSSSSSASRTGSKTEYIWLPSSSSSDNNNNNAAAAVLDPTKFCQLLNGRSILLVGDSMTQQYYKALGARLGMSKPQRHAHGFHVGFSGKICTGTNNDNKDIDNTTSRLAFLRVDYLTTLEKHDETDPYIRDPIEQQQGNWWKWIDQYEVLVLNTGAHALSPDRHEKHLRAVYTKLQHVYNKGAVFFRTTPRGHVGCSARTGDDLPNRIDSFFPPNNDNNNISQLYYNQYHYDWVHQNNAAYRKLIPAHQLLDVAPITELRPDGHSNPPQDCLHYKSVDVFEPWSYLLWKGLARQGAMQ